MKAKRSLFLIILIITITAGFAQEVQEKTEYPNLVKNGDFESGNVGFKSDFIFAEEGVWIWGYYVITDNAAQYLDGVTFQNPVPNTGKYYAVQVDGSRKQRLWYDSITVKPNTTYSFSCILANISSDQGGKMILKVNGKACCPCPARSLLSGSCVWTPFSEQYKTGPDETKIEISIVDEIWSSIGNDVALDNIEFKELPEDTTITIRGKLIEIGEPNSNCGVLAKTSSIFVFCNDRDGSKAYIVIDCPEFFKQRFFVVDKKYEIVCTKSQIESYSVFNPKNYTNLLFEKSIVRLD
jgi:hypothetical protein